LIDLLISMKQIKGKKTKKVTRHKLRKLELRKQNVVSVNEDFLIDETVDANTVDASIHDSDLDESLDFEEDDTCDDDYIEAFTFEGHIELLQKFKMQFYQLLQTSLKRKSWGSKKDRDILAISFQVGTFFAWVNREKKWSLGDDFDFDAMFDWFVDIAPRPHTILEDFAAHLDDDHKKLPSTTKTYLISLRIFAKWFGAQRNISVDTFKDAIKSLIRQYNKEINKYRSETQSIIRVISFTHDMNPITHDINPFTHSINPFTHNINPFTHNTYPFSHNMNSFTNYMSPFTHGMNAFAHDMNFSTHNIYPFTH